MNCNCREKADIWFVTISMGPLPLRVEASMAIDRTKLKKNK